MRRGAAGEVMFGTDSHTCNAGAFGQFASGIGNTDAGFILGTGKLLIKVRKCVIWICRMPEQLTPTGQDFCSWPSSRGSTRAARKLLLKWLVPPSLLCSSIESVLRFPGHPLKVHYSIKPA